MRISVSAEGRIFHEKIDFRHARLRLQRLGHFRETLENEQSIGAGVTCQGQLDADLDRVSGRRCRFRRHDGAGRKDHAHNEHGP
jgi:hypothetical protein